MKRSRATFFATRIGFRILNGGRGRLIFEAPLQKKSGRQSSGFELPAGQYSPSVPHSVQFVDPKDVANFPSAQVPQKSIEICPGCVLNRPRGQPMQPDTFVTPTALEYVPEGQRSHPRSGETLFSAVATPNRPAAHASHPLESSLA